MRTKTNPKATSVRLSFHNPNPQLTPSRLMNLPALSSSRRTCRALRAMVPTLLIAITASISFAQNTPRPGDADRTRRGGGDDNGGRRGGFNPEDMQARLRERFEVTDDEEWKLISDRITKVNELRRNGPGGGAMMAFAGRGPQGG